MNKFVNNLPNVASLIMIRRCIRGKHAVPT